MESKWRMNVVDLGWSMGPYRLIARLQNQIPFFEIFLAGIEGQTNQYATLIRLDGTSATPTETGRFYSPLNFPAGIAVEPD